MQHVMFSAGAGSFRSAMLARHLSPRDPRFPPGHNLRLVFVDTLYEDADAYRFLLEGAAHVFDRPLKWAPRAEDFPDYRVAADVAIESYVGNPEWRAFLADLRERAARELPELVWLVEGRDPWEVFRDERFVGNSRVDPCSKYLKRAVLDRWRERECDREADSFLIGIGSHEAHRFDDGKGGGLRPRMAEQGWRYEAPLLDIDACPDPPKGALRLAHAPLGEIGPRPPRLYGLNYVHNNCGGMCVKGGHAHWQNRFRVHPERFAYDAMMERKVRDFLGDRRATMLNDRRGGERRPMSLDAFGDRLRRGPSAVRYEYEPGSSGCGCMVDG